MSSQEIPDVIVVGAGLAGLACAHQTASAGLQTLLLERGEVAGAKNLSGGRLYLEPVRELCGDLLQDAPFERPVVSEAIALCDETSSLGFRIDQEPESKAPHSVTVLRARLDAHLANRVTEKGGMVLANQRADRLVFEDGRVTGVVVGPESLHARVVVAADGVLSFLAQEAGLRLERRVPGYGVGIKEIIQLEGTAIEERFNLAPGQGAARLYLGRVTRGLPGGGFVYTNRESLSVGLVVQLRALQGWNLEPKLWELLEQFKQRPEVAALVRGGTTVEYGAHLIPEGGPSALPPVGLPGLLLLGDAAGLVINTGAVLRGMDLALASGVLAGRSIVECLAAGLGPEACLESYRRALSRSFVMRQMREHQRASKVLSLDRLYHRYPPRLINWARDLLRVDASGEHLPMRKAFKRLRREVLGWRGLRDLWRLIRM